MPRKGKVKRCNDDKTSEKAHQEVLHSDLEKISKLRGPSGQPDSENNPTDRSISEEKASEHKISTLVSNSPQQVQEPLLTDNVQGSVGKDKQPCTQETSTKCMLEEKVMLKEDEVHSKVDEDTVKELTEGEGSEKSDMKKVEKRPKQSSPLLLKWSNKQPTQAKGKRKKEKKKEEKQSRQTEVSDYFPVRRSDRKCKSAIENEKQKALEQALLSGTEEGLEIREVEGKGRGVFTTQDFTRGQFVCEYAGDLIDYKTAKEREKFYEGKTEFGCYMYYFSFKNKKLCVDATKESGRLGRLLNHSKTKANCATRLVCVQDSPYLILETIRDVSAGEELLYDYGERSKDVIQVHEWLKS